MARHLKKHQTWLNGAAGLRSQRTTFRGRDSGDLLEAITVSLIYLCLLKLLLGTRILSPPFGSTRRSNAATPKRKMQRYNHPSRAMLAQSEAEEEYKAIPSLTNSCRRPPLSHPHHQSSPLSFPLHDDSARQASTASPTLPETCQSAQALNPSHCTSGVKHTSPPADTQHH